MAARAPKAATISIEPKHCSGPHDDEHDDEHDYERDLV